MTLSEQEEQELPVVELEEASLLLEEQEVVEEEEMSEQKFPWKLLSGLVSGLLVVSLLMGFYFLYPATWKVKGDWKTKTRPFIEMSIDSSKNTTIEFLNYGGARGITLQFIGKLEAVNFNKYQLTKIKGELHFDKDQVSSDQLKPFDENRSFYKPVSGTKQTVQYQLTKKGLEKLMGTKEAGRYFVFDRVSLIPWKTPTFWLNNSLVSERRIEFTKE
ncbi:hypothetical protein IGJ02_002619 [Enterococcus sp. DIV0724b]|uniref:hypothetical protein n=1 Tax=Enterococcus sp. DIV0724b TaxID=2774694 RepID=UPI003D2FB0FE